MADLAAEREALRLKLEEVERQQVELDSLQKSLQKEHAENASQTQVGLST